MSHGARLRPHWHEKGAPRPAVPETEARPVSNIPPQFFRPQHWQILPAQMIDLSFIMDSWCSDEHTFVGRPGEEDPDVAKAGMRARVLRLTGASKCAVVRPTKAFFELHQIPIDMKKLFGWMCYGRQVATLRPVIHFIYIRPVDPTTGTGLRKRGLADALLLHAARVTPESGAWATHTRLRLTQAMRKRGILPNKYLLECDVSLLNAKLPGEPRELDPYQEQTYKWK